MQCGAARAFPLQSGAARAFPLRFGAARAFPLQVGAARAFPLHFGAARAFPLQTRWRGAVSYEVDFEPWAAGFYLDSTWRSAEQCCDEVIFEPWAAGFQVQSSRAQSCIVQQASRGAIQSCGSATRVLSASDEQDPQRAKNYCDGRPTPGGLLERRPVQGQRFTASGPSFPETTLETRPEKGPRSHEMSFPNPSPDGALTFSPQRAPTSFPSCLAVC